MAQRNPVVEAETLSSTGSVNEPINTGSNYATTGNTHTAPAGAVGTHNVHTGKAGTHSGFGNAGTGTTTGTSTGHQSGGGVKGVMAGIHGLGEKIRGEFNAGVDEAFNDNEGTAKNRAVADAGDRERLTGTFAGETKNREGAVPGADHGRRY